MASNPSQPLLQEDLSPPRLIRRILLTLVRLGIGIGLLVYLAQSQVINLPALLRLFTAWPITFAAVALLLFDILLMALRLSWLFRPQGLRLSLRMSLQLTLVGFFFATFLPGAAAIRALETIRAYRHSWGTLAAVLGAAILANLSLIVVTALGVLVVNPAGLAMKMSLVIPMGYLANSLPLTPGGLGVGETAFNALFTITGLSGGADALLCWRIWSALVGILGLILYLRGLRRSLFDGI